MITKGGFRNLLESGGGDPRRFGARLTNLLGLTDPAGRFHFGRHGRRVLKPAANGETLHPDEIPVRALLETLLGDDAPAAVARIPHMLTLRAMHDPDPRWGRSLLEDTGAGAVMPSAFANINAFTAVTSGLLEASILQAYENPEFIGDQLAPVEPSSQFEGRKSIGVTRLGNVAEERLPGMPTKRVQVGERWMTQPRTVEKALACEVTQEAMFLDLTGGQLAEHCGAAGVGEWLGYNQELDIIDAFIGVSTSVQFNYKGTTYAPYIAAGYYDNYISSGNELVHEDNLQTVMIKFRDMKDPDTNTRTLINPNTMLVNREKVRTAEAIAGPTAQAYQLRDNESAGAGVKTQINVSTPYYKGKLRLLESPLVYERCNASDGLNLSASNSGKVWWVFESGPKTMVWVQNWPLRTQTAAPNQIDMIDRGVVMYTKADLRGTPMWKDPRRSVESRA